MKRIPFILFAAFCLAFYSCKTDKTKTTKTTTDRVIAKKTDTQVKADLDNLLQEMDATWNEMIASDDQKIDNLQTLLARVGRDKNYDKSQLTTLLAERENLKTKRYDRQQIKDVTAVDAYDSAQIKLMDATYQLIEANNLAARDTIAGQLASKIQEDDSRVPILRAYYDKAAKNFNQYLKDYQPQIQKLGPPYSEMKPAPLFVEQPLL
ncbi:hypothetical protein I5M27_16395 [Adhaeribacter sp. BT258]|uniref:Lipoprotein n=1 Tax=Adhaeribacter terrigena TaxID=2793070 RepID=A0ABS1C5B0_9BACT|nr:hypothetical protein [Adhaeribacter terrigena]MBK0404577.1 hypothetical protein [Adhaeribacter terrigena]